ncbi:MAG: YgiQ family radical SAM protein [Clostridia bacterium]|nr:YgiQ family radical SAM protein [Clostridia bacterium]
MAFLPVTKEELNAMGKYYCDFIVVTGDAYVDHPSFGIAIISRLLESCGFTVGIIARPDYKSADSFRVLGRPRYGFMVSSGAIDSMVSNYTAAKRVRSDDLYAPGGKGFGRPDRAVIVYTNKIREAYPDVPVAIGGLEASLRRFAHYDYWDDRVRHSILIDSGADLLMYGMGERQILEIARRVKAGESIRDMEGIRGTCVVRQSAPPASDKVVYCDSFEKVSTDKRAYAKSFKLQSDEHDPVRGRTVVQKHGKRFLIQYPPQPPLTTPEMDAVYALPYERTYHPSYEAQGGVPAIKEVEFSITVNRGCFGACAFCSLAFHQGRMISTRSDESVIAEAKSFLKNPRFKGYISDVGGPTANFHVPSCDRQKEHGMCKDRRCLTPKPCPNLNVTHKSYDELLRKLRRIDGIKKVFIRSGIRFDYLMLDDDRRFFEDLVRYHISGQLKVAPEHCSDRVLYCMGKPPFSVYESFVSEYGRLNKKFGMDQYLVPYLMSSHPGSELSDAVELALYLKKKHMSPEQVQDFYPTPGTMATAAYYSGIDPMTGREVFVPRTREEKAMQRALLQFGREENRERVIAALKAAGRYDLIGHGAGKLVSPDAKRSYKDRPGQKGSKGRKDRRSPPRRA